ncbi:MAG: DUF58 domain-containing protein [Magnetovibrio sp.]|nr:DUF58 domain-containing protein [Magnetovibrio sp.]
MSATWKNKPMSAETYHRAEALGLNIPPLLVAAERVASTVSQGVHGRRRVGQGETFWQFRRYGTGDTIQCIDWRRSAREGPLYVRDKEWEAAQSIWLWRDGSPSMDFCTESGGETKYKRAELLLLALASLLVRGGERVALLETEMLPASDRTVMHQLWTMMQNATLASEGLPRVELLPRYARLVIIGDFFSPLEEIKAVVDAYAAQGVRGHIIQVLDPAEETLPYEGRVVFEDPESKAGLLVSQVSSLRSDYQREMTRHCESLEILAARVGWTFSVHNTNRSPVVPLMALYLQLSKYFVE